MNVNPEKSRWFSQSVGCGSNGKYLPSRDFLRLAFQMDKSISLIYINGIVERLLLFCFP